MTTTDITPAPSRAYLPPAGDDQRAAVITAHANLVAFLQTHPGLPLGDKFSGPFEVYVSRGTDEENRAEVDRIAAEFLGVEAKQVRGSTRQYAADRDFGAGIRYRVFAIARRTAAAA